MIFLLKLFFILTITQSLSLYSEVLFSWQVEGRHGGSRAVLQIPHGGEFPGDPGCGRGGCWEVHRPGTSPGTRTLPESNAHACGQWWEIDTAATFCWVLRLPSAVKLLCVCVCFLSDSESSDRGEGGVVAGPGLSAPGEQTGPPLHVPRSPSSSHPVALASLPVQRPVSSQED